MDRISELSDELLIKILLFLPTKLAVSTSLLSKRWECLWLWLPRLKYDGRSRSNTDHMRLRCFLDRNLPLHKAPVIERLCLRLNYSNFFEPEDFEMYVRTAVSRIIHELKVSYSEFGSVLGKLPSNLYSCNSLVTLELKGMILLDVPRFVCLASLKTLKLRRLTYVNEGSFQQLLSICPVLKLLSVHKVKNDNMGKKISVISRSLQSLSICTHSQYFECDLDGFVIDAPSLEHFKLKDTVCKSRYFLAENMPKLSEAYVDVGWPDIKSLIRSIASVNRLTICLEAMYGDGIVFHQLEHLKLCVRREDSLNLLMQLLKDSPKLRTLELFIMREHQNDGDIDCWNEPSIVPECLLSSLETFKWSGFEGFSEERDLVVYILKNCHHLKTTTIVAYECDEIEPHVIQELALCSRASPMCQFTCQTS